MNEKADHYPAISAGVEMYDNGKFKSVWIAVGNVTVKGIVWILSLLLLAAVGEWPFGLLRSFAKFFR